MDDGLWSRVIRVKYLRTYNSIQWLRNYNFSASRASAMSHCIYNTVDNLRPWLKWRIGNGSYLFVGVDPFIGDEEDQKFNAAFICALWDRRLVVLS